MASDFAAMIGKGLYRLFQPIPVSGGNLYCDCSGQIVFSGVQSETSARAAERSIEDMIAAAKAAPRPRRYEHAAF